MKRDGDERGKVVVVFVFCEQREERTDERAPVIIYISGLDRPDGCIIAIIVERESETRVEPFCSWTSRELVNRVTSAHFTRTITRLSLDHDPFSSFLRRSSLYTSFSRISTTIFVLFLLPSRNRVRDTLARMVQAENFHSRNSCC